jgi:MFS family permease
LNIPPDNVGYYFGILNSLSYVYSLALQFCLVFTFPYYRYAGEALSVWCWGLLSDKFGRKPILLVCSFGLALTLVSFGLSTTFAGLAISRLSEGLLNGISGTIKAILAELANGDEENLAEVFSLMPVIWAVGATIG